MRILKKGKLQEYIAACPNCETVFVYTAKDAWGTSVRCPLCEITMPVDYLKYEGETLKGDEKLLEDKG